MKLSLMGGLQFDLDTNVNTEYTNNGLVNSILHQTFGSSLTVSCIVFAFFIVLMVVGSLISYSIYRILWRNGAAIRQIQAYLRSKSNPQVCSSV